ncbi:MAG: RNA polymerase sigma factor [Croceimicrobium sp.]|nr:RNA polymerase sigma-70 factor [Bacteroidota bacterium]
MSNTNPDNTHKAADDLKDHELLAAIASSDEKALQQFFNRYYKTLVGTAFNILKDEEQAKDIVQDLFFWLWKNRESLSIKSSVLAYFKRATINRCLNLLKKNQKFSDQEDWQEPIQASPNPQELMEAQELEAFVAQALLQLPERCRLIFTLKRLEGLSVKEIAEKLEISPKTVENQITKALKHLSSSLKPYLAKNNSPP